MDVPTYNKINLNMMKTSMAMLWGAEFGEWNYEMNVEILKCLYKNKNPEHKDYDENDKKEIKQLGQDIYDRGGFDALQANFYIMSYFMDFCEEGNETHKTHISSLNALFNRIGEWRY